MSLSLILQGAQVGAKVLSNVIGGDKADRIANLQRETVEKYNEFNKKQIQRSYETAFGNAMSDYVDNRIAIVDVYEDVNTKLNIEAMQNGINLADSSYQQDAQNQLDMEFNTNLQNNYTNLINQTAQLAVNKEVQTVKLEQNYANQINSINNMASMVEEQSMNNLMSDIGTFIGEGVLDYRTYGARQKIKGKEASFTDYVSNDLLNFSLGDYLK